MFIKSILKELSNKKLSSILITIQLVITIIILVYSYDSIRMLNYPAEQLKSILDNDYKNVYQIKAINATDSQDFSDMFNKFDAKLKETFNYENIGAFHLTNTQFEELEGNEEFMNLRRTLTKGTFKEVYPQAIELYTVDYSIYKLMNIKIESGRNLDKNDFVDKPDYIIPMIISNTYKGIINIDDVLTSKLDNRKYKVVGFFNENLKWLYKSAPVSSELVSLNDKIITPYIIDTSGLQTAIKAQSYFYINNSKLPEATVKSDINVLGSQFNLNINCKSLDNQLEEITNANKETIFYGILISGFLTIVSCFGLSIIMYYSINKRKTELGIRIMCGGSINYIKSLVIGEIGILMMVSFLVSSLLLRILRGETSVSSNIVTLYDIKTTGIIFIFLLVFSLVSSLVPLIRISKLNPKELIGGVE